MTINGVKNYLDFCSFGFVLGSLCALRVWSLNALLLGALLGFLVSLLYPVAKYGLFLGLDSSRNLSQGQHFLASRFLVMLAGITASWVWVWCYSNFVVRLELPNECQHTDLVVKAEVVDFPRQMRWGDLEPFSQLRLRLLAVDLAKCRGIESARVYYAGDERIALGDVLTGTLKLRSIRGFANFSEDSRAAQAIASREIARGRLVEISSMRGTESQVARARLFLAERIDAQSSLSAAAKGVLKALVLGFKDGIPEDLRSTYSSLGIGHLLVISGLHVGFLGGVLILLLRWMLRPLCLSLPLGMVQCLIAICAFVLVLSYAGLAGGSLPVVRATAAFGGWLLADLLGRGGQPIRLFWWILCVALALNPFTSLLPSFWLSFGAVFVVLCAGVVVRRFSIRARTALTHVIVCLSVAPVGALYFQQLPLLSIPSNLIAIPIVSFLVVPSALAASILELAGQPGLAEVLWNIASAPIGLTERSTGSGSLNVFGVEHTAGVLVTALASMALLAFWMPISWRWRAVCVAILIFYWIPLSGLNKGDQATLTVFDVGQGSSALFEASGQTLLFDLAGGLPETFHIYDQTVWPYLLEKGVHSVSHVVVSHDDFDHSGGWYSSHFDRKGGHLTSAGAFLEGSEPCVPGRVESWSSEIQLLWLSGFDRNAGFSDNDGSCVLQIRAFGRSILLVGDVGQAHERDMVRFWRDQLKSDMLVVSHHGSNTSTSATWLKWVQPSFAVVSAGFDNHFGHPHQAVLERLARAKTCVLDTSKAGAIRLTWSRASGIAVESSRNTVRRFWQHNARSPCS